VVIPLRGFYASLIERKTLPGPNPAADLKFFIGKSARSKAQHPKFFSQDEGPKLIEAAQALYPRWAVFWSCPGSVDGELLSRASLYCPRGG
jgi:hypothetical protein